MHDFTPSRRPARASDQDPRPFKDFYAEASAIQETLGANGLASWADRIEERVIAGATGSEILMGVRWVLKQLREEVSLPSELDTSAHELVMYIDRALRE